MAAFLAYIEPVPGRLYPLVPTLVELKRRGHRVAVRTGVAEAELLHRIGIDAGLLAPEPAHFAPTDWQARTRFGALMRALDQFGERAAAAVRAAIALRPGAELVASAFAHPGGPVAAADALDQLAAGRAGEGTRSGPSTGGPSDVVEGGQP